MPHIHIAALGGTIASTGHGAAAGVRPQVGAEEIAAAAALPTLAQAPRVTFEQIAQVSSGEIRLEDLEETVRAARRAAAQGARAVVLTQGTDTIEETAFALALLNDSGIPIVVTGAMRGPEQPGADGPANVRAAVIAGLDERLADSPALVVFNDEVHDPLWVRKAHTSSPAAFTSGPAAGPVGWLSEDALVLAHLPAPAARRFAVSERPAAEAPAGTTGLPRVLLVEAGVGEDFAIAPALPDAGYAGAVIAGVGGGHVRAEAAERLGQLAATMPVVLASRTGSGRVLERTYGYPGGDIDLIARGLIPAGRLDARKARIVLILALGAGADPAEALGAFG
ncbi:asparaginase domain-containing protein [Brevibacterium rongguiense]|uniref:asparaginase domain-containing protein n=1 Tax=Brevibacterium rongguiense TaxID=2695267 RepID=UPI002E2B9398|nr:asparaginase domain-containing protein [Brevibacterium rongguiense]